MKISTVENDAEVCGMYLASKLEELLKEGKKILWLVPGGSNIPISVVAMRILRQKVSKEELVKLTISLTDERYGEVGHADSNWQQLTEAGFDLQGIRSIPVLSGLSIEETVKAYSKNIDDAIQMANITLGQFGIGADGHIAGILPHSIAVNSLDTAVSYQATPFTRISLTLQTLKKLSIAYSFAFGASKRETLNDLCSKDISLDQQPSQVLKKIPEAYLYVDGHQR